MEANKIARPRVGRGHAWLRVGALTATILAGTVATAPGCLDRPIEPVEPKTTSVIIERLTQSSVDKIDLVLVIDNSRSMADKQEILRLAVPDLVNSLVNPICVDDAGLPGPMQPPDPLTPCADGFKREFEPILNIHVGVITSSLGGHGADACAATMIVQENDHGRLINRTLTPMAAVDFWNGKDFLVWDPDTMNPTHTPPGATVQTKFISDVGEIVGGAGEIGCGYEATLESWYRFLVDPDPFCGADSGGCDTKPVVENNNAVLNGTDAALIQQRADFLRPDSLLAIIMLSDENDCSIRDGGQFFFAAQIFSGNNPYHLPKARAVCASDPNNPCCRSCGQPAGDGCDVSQDCAMPTTLPNEDDNINLRCWEQKRRFGIDFLYPVERYVTGLTSSQVSDRNGNVVPNPVFSDLNPQDTDTAVRDSGLVFIAGIVGVPWQDIARQRADGTPDLLAGLNVNGEAVGGFKSGAEMLADGTWDIILGDPTQYAGGCSSAAPGPRCPSDPLMFESVCSRSGMNPVTGAALTPPGPMATNPINGAEYTIACAASSCPENKAAPCSDDLQYACIFDLQTPRDCTDPNATACDCTDPMNDNPLCNPTTRTEQIRAKAYPGIRELQLLKAVGIQGIPASICPEQQTDNMLFNFGYRPAVGAIIERLKQALGGQCLPRTLTANIEGQVPCLIIEALNATQCICDATKGRRPISVDHPAVQAILQDPLAAAAGWSCFCEIVQTQGGDLAACQGLITTPPGNEISETPVNAQGVAVNGWCYVDSTTVPPTGNPDIVEGCPETEKRIIRFVGEGQGVPGATLFITCSGE